MTTKTNTDPEQLLADAEAEVTEASDTLAELEQRVMDGDAEVQPQQIAEAAGLRRFAKLRQQAAEKKAGKLRQAALERQQTAALDEARSILAEHPRSEVDAKLTAACDAMAELRAAVRDYNDGARRAYDVLAASPLEPVHVQIGRRRGEPMPTYPELGYGLYPGQHRRVLWLDGRDAFSVDEARLMDEARQHPALKDHEAAQAAREAEQPARQAAREAKRAERRANDPNAL